ncbi:hypothetical protein [Candidatus Villigracilis saccharophilus]|uniref:hypothetical protein n=1 Tax=Candidatus Villigracilis saccharophilus TaxID=3140684 RepID=UPI00313560BB|nr:hypothetical protein [Anaerolineales bacterium]
MLIKPRSSATRSSPSGLADANGESRTTASVIQDAVNISLCCTEQILIPRPKRSGRDRKMKTIAATVINASA